MAYASLAGSVSGDGVLATAMSYSASTRALMYGSFLRLVKYCLRAARTFFAPHSGDSACAIPLFVFSQHCNAERLEAIFPSSFKRTDTSHATHASSMSDCSRAFSSGESLKHDCRLRHASNTRTKIMSMHLPREGLRGGGLRSEAARHDVLDVSDYNGNALTRFYRLRTHRGAD